MTALDIGVLGCGPAGLLAANAASAMGHGVTVFSKGKERSYIAGAQYLHEPLMESAGERLPDTYIRISKEGTQEGYATKVYGLPDAPVSWQRYEEGEYPAWNMRAVYDALWDVWKDRMVDATLTPRIAQRVASEGVLEVGGHEWRKDAWISTVPLAALCRRNGDKRIEPGPEHSFMAQRVHIAQDENYGNHDDPSFIVYNGEDHPSWYRRSVIFGCEAVEWSGIGPKPPVDNVVTITKPLASNCDCFDEATVPIMLSGRYGAWHKEFLSHHVQQDTVKFLGYLGG